MPIFILLIIGAVAIFGFCYFVTCLSMFSFQVYVFGEVSSLVLLLGFWVGCLLILGILSWTTRLGYIQPLLKDATKGLCLAGLVHAGVSASLFSGHALFFLPAPTALIYFGSAIFLIHKLWGLDGLLRTFHVFSPDKRALFTYRPTIFEHDSQTIIVRRDSEWTAIKWIEILDWETPFKNVLQHLLVSDQITDLSFGIQRKGKSIKVFVGVLESGPNYSDLPAQVGYSLHEVRDQLQRYGVTHETVSSDYFQECVYQLPFLEWDCFSPLEVHHGNSVRVVSNGSERSFSIFRLSEFHEPLHDFLQNVQENPATYDDFATILRLRKLNEYEIESRMEKLQKEAFEIARQLSDEMDSDQFTILKKAFGEKLEGADQNSLLRHWFRSELQLKDQIMDELQDFARNAELGIWDAEFFFMGSLPDSKSLRTSINGQIEDVSARKLPRCVRRQHLKPRAVNTQALLRYLPFPLSEKSKN